MRKTLSRLAVVATAAAVSLLLGEAVVRLLVDPPPVRRVWHPFAHRVPQPNLVDRFRDRDGRLVVVRLNELGMRGPSLTGTFPDDGLTVVFLGGSTTECYVLPRSESFPELVGRELERRLSGPVRVFNAGMSGAGSAHSLARLAHQVVPLEPDLVVVMHAVNDLLAGFHPRFSPDGKHLRRPPDADARPRSALLFTLRSALSRRHPAALTEEQSIEDFGNFPALLALRRNLRSMAAIAAAHGIDLVVLTQPHRYDAIRSFAELPEDRMRHAVAREGGVPPDLAAMARGMAAFNTEITNHRSAWDLCTRVGKDPELFIDGCHLSAAGSRAVAAILVDHLEDVLRRRLLVDEALDPVLHPHSRAAADVDR